MKRTSPPCLLVVFGASGDLAMRKLLPAIFHLSGQDLLDPSFTVLGFARTAMDDDQFRQHAVEGLREHSRAEHNGSLDEQRIDDFASRLFYQAGGYDDLGA